MLKMRVVIVVLISWSISCTFSMSRENDINWTHQVSLRGGVQLKWTNNDPTWIRMELSAPTKGYLGIGFSPHGGMAGSDIALGWVDDTGNPYFKDYHGVENGEPVEDSSQDYELIYASEDDSGTKIVFKRKWDTGDICQDHSIGNHTLRLIWAWHSSDPNPNGHLHWHGPGSQRSVQRINFKDPNRRLKFADNKGSSDNTTLYFDVTLYNVRVPKLETYYHCQIFKWPTLGVKHHIVGYRPLIRREHLPYIRQMSILTCVVPKRYGRTKDYFEKYLIDPTGHGQPCFADETPKDWTQFCVISLITSSIGSEGKILPDHLGWPIGEDGTVYMRLEIQYENTEGADILDSSGLRIFYTPALRKHDAGSLVVGHRRTPFLTIPPFQQRFKISGHCSAECTQLGIEGRGVRFYSILFNSHGLARRHILRHIRNGKDLPPISQANNYDFHYQEYQDLSKEIWFFPGDELLLECEFDSSVRTSSTFGGPSVRHEMCQATILYYPKSALGDCRSQPELYSYFNALGVQNISGDLVGHLGIPRSLIAGRVREESAIPDDSDVIFLDHPGLTLEDVLDTRTRITKPEKFEGLSWLTYLNALTGWKNEEFVHNVESQWRNGQHYIFCATSAGKRIQLNNKVVKLHNYEPFESESRTMCDWQEFVSSASIKSPGIELTSLFLLTLTVFLLSLLKVEL